MTPTRTTIKDIARRAGISHQAVSYALNNRTDMVGAKTLELVKQLAREMQYIPNHQARSLKTRRSGFIGLYAPQRMEAHPYFTGTQLQIRQYLNGHGCKTVLLGDYKNTDEPVNLYRSGQVDGFLYFLSAPSLGHFEQGTAQELLKKDVPFVLLHGTSSMVMDFPNVGFDNTRTGYLAAKKLLDAGFTEIGYACPFPSSPAPLTESLAGHTQALAESGVGDADRFIYKGDDLRAGSLAVKEMASIVDGPFGVSCYNQETAMAAANTARELGLVPGKDVGITAGGPDMISPGLQAVLGAEVIEHIKPRQEERSKAAVDMLMEILEKGKASEERIIIDPEGKGV